MYIHKIKGRYINTCTQNQFDTESKVDINIKSKVDGYIISKVDIELKGQEKVKGTVKLVQQEHECSEFSDKATF